MGRTVGPCGVARKPRSPEGRGCLLLFQFRRSRDAFAKRGTQQKDSQIEELRARLEKLEQQLAPGKAAGQ